MDETTELDRIIAELRKDGYDMNRYDDIHMTMSKMGQFLEAASSTSALLNDMTTILPDTDFSLDKMAPNDGLKFFHHPFRASLFQVGQKGCSTFNDARNVFHTLCLMYGTVENYVKDDLRFLLHGSRDEAEEKLLSLKKIGNISDESLNLVKNIEYRITELLNVIDEHINALNRKCLYYDMYMENKSAYEVAKTSDMKEIEQLARTRKNQHKFHQNNTNSANSLLENDFAKSIQEDNITLEIGTSEAKPHLHHLQTVSKMLTESNLEDVTASATNTYECVKPVLRGIQTTHEKEMDDLQHPKEKLTEVSIRMNPLDLEKIEAVRSGLNECMKKLVEVKKQCRQLFHTFQMFCNLIKCNITSSFNDFVDIAKRAGRIKVEGHQLTDILRDVLIQHASAACYTANLFCLMAKRFLKAFKGDMINLQEKLSDRSLKNLRVECLETEV